MNRHPLVLAPILLLSFAACSVAAESSENTESATQELAFDAKLQCALYMDCMDPVWKACTARCEALYPGYGDAYNGCYRGCTANQDAYCSDRYGVTLTQCRNWAVRGWPKPTVNATTAP
jgi:hypothetical protein